MDMVSNAPLELPISSITRC